MSRARRGFTIMEVTIVLLIIGIMAAVAVPTFSNSLMYHRIESAARRVKLDLQLARREAMKTSTNRKLEFLSATTYQIPQLASLDRSQEAYVVQLAKDPYQLSTAKADFSGLGQVVFNGYGMPSSGGTIQLQLAGHQREVVLDGTTGNVTINAP